MRRSSRGRRRAKPGPAEVPEGAHRAWLRFVPSALLIVVAVHQLVLARDAALSPWLGGGFGMFSTTDVGSRRHLHAFVLRPGIEREVVAPPHLEEAERRARGLPSEPHLRDLALELATTSTPDHGAATGVRVEVWRTRYDPKTLTPTDHLLRELRLALGEE